MAQGVRTRQEGLTVRRAGCGAIVAGLLVACGEPTSGGPAPVSRDGSQDGPAAAAGPYDQASPRSPQAQLTPPEDISAASHLALLLNRVEGPVTGALTNCRLALCDPDDADDEGLGISLSAPGRMRLDLPSGGYAVVVGEAGVRVEGRSDGPSVHTPLAGDELAELVQLQRSLEALTLHPLRDATAVRRWRDPERGDAHTFEFTSGGQRWTVELANHGLPERIAAGTVDVKLLQWVAPTSETAVPTLVAFGADGARRLRIESPAVRFEPSYFDLEPPANATVDAAAVRVLGGEERPSQPTRVQRPPTRWLVREDPGTWPGRHEAFWEAGWPIHRAACELDGFGWLFDSDGPRLAIPFRPADPASQPAAEVEVPPGWKLVVRAAGQALVIYPPEGGTLAERTRAAQQALQDHAHEHGIRLSGPMRVAPYVHLNDKRPTTPEQLAAKPLRVEWDIRH